NKTFRVFHMIDGLKLIGLNGELVDAVDVNRLELLKGYEKLFSSRAYIWSVSIPMLKDYIWIGAGPDMYPIAFNQNDFVGIANGYMTNTIVDKPHNMYIQIGINTGILSLLALFAAFIVVIVKLSISTFKSKGEDLSDYFSVGVLVALIAYLATSFFNDQMISIAPLFYICLGLGLAIVENRKKSSTIIDKEINY
ncbi:MAG: O-antigen ligase domain-containing protein, partial [Candidatus Moranbacteria bacterium]|nr:O-antigen ligase domain-containing protein [Candidatus Moranbacteria bacterium]